MAVWYGPVARQLLGWGGQQPLRLIPNATKVSAGHQLTMVALAHKQRVRPVAWTRVDYARGTVPIPTQVALLQRVKDLLPAGQANTVVADCGFASVPRMRQLVEWGWGYVLRQYSNAMRWPIAAADWQRLDRLVSAPGQPAVWVPAAGLTRRWGHPTAVLADWQIGYDQPWLLATNLASGMLTRQAYARQMGIEEMLGDFKRHGWDLETTHLRHAERLSRLILAVALLYVWLVLLGQRSVKGAGATGSIAVSGAI